MPAVHDADALPGLLGALAEQVEAHGRPLQPGVLEVLILAPGLSAEDRRDVRRMVRRHPRLRALFAFAPISAPLVHGALARTAVDRVGPSGLVLTASPTDRPAPDWVAREWRIHQRGAHHDATRQPERPDAAAPALVRLAA